MSDDDRGPRDVLPGLAPGRLRGELETLLRRNARTALGPKRCVRLRVVLAELRPRGR